MLRLRILIQMTCQTLTELSPAFFCCCLKKKKGKKRINVPSMWQRQLCFPSFSLLYSLWIFSAFSLLPFLSLACESLAASCCSTPFSAEKAGQMWQIWSYFEITPTKQRFSTWSIPDPGGSLCAQNWAAFFPPFLFNATVGFQSAERVSAKKHFISDPIISSA